MSLHAIEAGISHDIQFSREKPVQSTLHQRLKQLESAGEPNRAILSVAYHEVNHALIARHYGVPMETISTIPEGKNLGRVTFAGYIPSEVFTTIAAGGALATHEGQAHGHGSDMQHIKKHGFSIRAKVAEAADTIRAIHPELRKKVARAVALFREMSGEEFNEIVSIMESDLGMMNNELPMTNDSDPVDKTITEYFEDTYVVTNIRKDTVLKTIFCRHCHVQFGHSPHCPSQKIVFTPSTKQAA